MIIIIYFINAADFYCELWIMAVTNIRALNGKTIQNGPLNICFQAPGPSSTGTSHKPFSLGHVCDHVGPSFPLSFKHYLVCPPFSGPGLFLLPVLIQPGTYPHKSEVQLLCF